MYEKLVGVKQVPAKQTLKAVEQSIGQFFDKNYLLRQKREKVFELLKRSMDRGAYRDNIKLHLKVLLALLNLNNVSEDEPTRREDKLEVYPKRLYDDNMAALMETWDSYSRIHEETCQGEDDSLNSGESEDEMVEHDEQQQAEIKRLFGRSGVSVSLGIKRLKDADAGHDDDKRETDVPELVFKSQFVRHDFLNNNRNVVSAETVNDLLSLLLSTTSDYRSARSAEDALKARLGSKIGDFAPETLFHRVFGFNRAIERLLSFCSVTNQNPIAQKLQDLVSSALSELQARIVALQHDLVAQVDAKRDPERSSGLLYKRTPALTFFQLDRWIIDSEPFYVFLSSLAGEFQSFSTTGEFTSRKPQHAERVPCYVQGPQVYIQS